MSELQQLCETLTAISREAARMAAGLHERAQNMSAAALQSAAVAGTDTRNPLGAQTVHGLQSAARSAIDAAALLHKAAEAGEAFVARTVAASASPGRSSDSVGGGASAPSQGSPAIATLQGISGWIGDINPGYDSNSFSPRSTNCGACALAVFEKLSGRDMGPAGTTTFSISEMEALTGKKQVPMTPGEIADALIQQGPGAHAVVGIDRQQGPGHWFNAYYDGQQVVAIDGQSGTVSGWPLDYGSPDCPVTTWDAGI
ncbi:hypothetical protein LFT45_17080 [Arthrobacter sp. FW305-BF8]|uniref:toxin glutamine deamidase domain-containing protein n=1 Tax=Arthrobacter sp. FW305-BF8 TaxID=2879617 RepID=UPI001F48C7E8|nr:toxin glutamine deamidase domain-containing protein [Arthrobacter sp. FW305-BF8]UKA53419.1 hypothetical protein LFT45_17080 [Arthrobacter sp. FW305-BF8]